MSKRSKKSGSPAKKAPKAKAPRKAKAPKAPRPAVPADVSACARELGRAGAAKRWAGHIKKSRPSRAKQAAAAGAAALAAIRPGVSREVSPLLREAMGRPDVLGRALRLGDAIRTLRAPLAPARPMLALPSGTIEPPQPPVFRTSGEPLQPEKAFALGIRKVQLGTSPSLTGELVRGTANPLRRAVYGGGPYDSQLYTVSHETNGVNEAREPLLPAKGQSGPLVSPTVGAYVATFSTEKNGGSIKDYWSHLALAPREQIVRGRVTRVSVKDATVDFTVVADNGKSAWFMVKADGFREIQREDWALAPWNAEVLEALDNRDRPMDSPGLAAASVLERWLAEKKAAKERLRAGDDRRETIISRARFESRLAFEDMSISELARALANAWGMSIAKGEDPKANPVTSQAIKRALFGPLPDANARFRAYDPGAETAMALVDQVFSDFSFDLESPLLRAQVGPSPDLPQIRAAYAMLPTSRRQRTKLVEDIANPPKEKAPKTRAPRKKKETACCGSCASGGVCETKTEQTNEDERGFNREELAALTRMFDYARVGPQRRAQILDAARYVVSRGGEASIEIHGRCSDPDPGSDYGSRPCYFRVFVSDEWSRETRSYVPARGIQGESVYSVDGLTINLALGRTRRSAIPQPEDEDTLRALGFAKITNRIETHDGSPRKVLTAYLNTGISKAVKVRPFHPFRG